MIQKSNKTLMGLGAKKATKMHKNINNEQMCFIIFKKRFGEVCRKDTFMCVSRQAKGIFLRSLPFCTYGLTH